MSDYKKEQQKARDASRKIYGVVHCYFCSKVGLPLLRIDKDKYAHEGCR